MRVRNFAILLMLIVIASSGCIVEAKPSTQAPATTIDHIWPPRVGEAYPNLQLMNSLGERVSLDYFKGRVILIEPIGMDCPACNAFAGGNRPGSASGFQGVQPQRGLPSVEEILDRYAGGTSLNDGRLVIVHLLLYAPGRKGPPSVEIARLWAEHFGLEENDDSTVLVGEDYLVGPASYGMIPGFQLVDSDFILRYDATGHHPKHNMWTELMPAIPAMLQQVQVARATED